MELVDCCAMRRPWSGAMRLAVGGQDAGNVWDHSILVLEGTHFNVHCPLRILEVLRQHVITAPSVCARALVDALKITCDTATRATAGFVWTVNILYQIIHSELCGHAKVRMVNVADTFAGDVQGLSVEARRQKKLELTMRAWSAMSPLSPNVHYLKQRQWKVDPAKKVQEDPP